MAKVLVADDLDLVRRLARRYLETAGHTVVQVQNGVEAVMAYQRDRPDVVLLDLQMPEMDGLNALKAIIKLDPAARVAIFTADSEHASVLGALQLGARDYVVKPFRPERLLQAVDRLLGSASTP